MACAKYWRRNVVSSGSFESFSSAGSAERLPISRNAVMTTAQ